MMITNPKIEPCCANQNPSLKPPICMVFNCSTNKIPQPKDTINQILEQYRDVADVFLPINIIFHVINLYIVN
jgi:hypothetical protein